MLIFQANQPTLNSHLCATECGAVNCVGCSGALSRGRKHLQSFASTNLIYLPCANTSHSLKDQVCLSLSCKRFFGLFDAIAKHPDLQFPRQPWDQPRDNDENSLRIPRTALRLRLEDKHWAYSARCLKLHPRRVYLTNQAVWAIAKDLYRLCGHNCSLRICIFDDTRSSSTHPSASVKGPPSRWSFSDADRQNGEGLSSPPLAALSSKIGFAKRIATIKRNIMI